MLKGHHQHHAHPLRPIEAAECCSVHCIGQHHHFLNWQIDPCAVWEPRLYWEIGYLHQEAEIEDSHGCHTHIIGAMAQPRPAVETGYKNPEPAAIACPQEASFSGRKTDLSLLSFAA